MAASSKLGLFFRSRAGMGFLLFALFCALLCVGVGCGIYRMTLAAHIAATGEEKTTALQLVDAFVTDYADLRGHFGAAEVPVPATFRARAIEHFNHMRLGDEVLRIDWVGRAGRSIATPPSDTVIAATIESFVGEPFPEPRSSFFAGAAGPVFRTVYPSIATDKSCVDCHNRLQPGLDWHINDVMGAFVIDAPAGPFLERDGLQSAALATALFIALVGVGLLVAILSHRSFLAREAYIAVLGEAKAEAEAASRYKSEFMANMSHELRTPLNAVIGFAELMRTETHGEIGQPYRDYAGHIHGSGMRLLGVINDILDLATIDAGRLELYEGEVGLAELCAACLEIMRPRATEARISIALPALAPGATIWADERLLKQALLNLLSNAVKFSPAGTEVRIAVAYPARGPIVISVIDRGIGIRAEDIPLILKPFIQADGTLRRQYEGTGLGLPLAKAIVELHGGELQIESMLDNGTTVSISLPDQRRRSKPDLPDEHASPAFAGRAGVLEPQL